MSTPGGGGGDRLIRVGVVAEGWEELYNELIAWLSEHDNYYPRNADYNTPLSTARKVENKLARWVLKQQNNRAILLEVLTERLDKLPGWSWTVGQLPTCGVNGLQGWMLNYKALHSWIQDHDGIYPTSGRAGSERRISSQSIWIKDSQEVALGFWLNFQRRLKAKNSKLMQGKWQGINRSELLEALPNWTWTWKECKKRKKPPVSLTQELRHVQQVADAPPALPTIDLESLGAEPRTFRLGSHPVITWKVMFDRVFEFWQDNHRLPTCFSRNDAEIELAEWYYSDECTCDPHKMEDERTRAKWLADFRELIGWAQPLPAEQLFRMLIV